MKNRNRIFAILMSLAMLLGVFALAIPAAADEPVVMAKNKKVYVNGIAFRFDPLSTHTNSKAEVNADGTVTLTMQQGDLFWIPSVTIDAQSELDMSVLMVSNNGGKNNGQMSSGVAWNVDAGDNNAWGENTDNTNLLNLQTNRRRRIVNGTVSQMSGGSSTTIGVYSGKTDENEKLTAFVGERKLWECDTVLRMKVYVTDNEGTSIVRGDLCSADGEVLTYDYYALGTAPKTMEGPVGYGVNWSGDNSDAGDMVITIQNFTVKNALVNGVRADFDMVSLLRDHEIEVPIMEFANEPEEVFEEDGAEIDFEFDVDSSVPETAELVVKRGTTEIARSALSTLTKGDIGYLWKAELDDVVNTDVLNFSLESEGTLIERSELTYALGEAYQAYLDRIRPLIVEDSTVEIETGIAFFTWKITLTEYVPEGAKLVMKKNGTTVNTVELNTLTPDADGICTVEYYLNCESETDVLTLCLEVDDVVVKGSATTYAYGEAYAAATSTVAPVHSSELNCKAYEIDFSMVEDMTLVPGENIVAGHRWIYVKNSADGFAKIENGKLRIKGSKGDMIIFDDLNLNKTNFRFVSEVTYLNVPTVASWDDLEAADVQAYQAYNAYFGHLVHLSDADADGNRTAFIQSCTPNGAYVMGATINPNAEAGSVIKPNRIGEGEGAYDDISKAKLATQYTSFRGDGGVDIQYFNGALGYGTPVAMHTLAGTSNNGYGKIGLYAVPANGSGGYLAANMANQGASVTLESRVGKMGYICSEDEVEVSVGKLYVMVKSTSSMTVDGEQFPIYGGNEITVASLAKESNKVIYAQLGDDILYPESKFTPNRLTVVTTKQVNLVSRKATAVGQTGLKWKFEIDKAGYDALLADPNVASVKVGLLIIPTTLANEGINRATFALAGSQGIDLDITASKTLDDTVYVFNGVRDIAKNERTISYSAVGYIQVTMADEHVVEQIADFSLGRHSNNLISLVASFDDEQEPVTDAPEGDVTTAPGEDVTTTAPKKTKKGCKSTVAGFAMIAVMTLAGASCACFKKKD